jgi:hypothetical protein
MTNCGRCPSYVTTLVDGPLTLFESNRMESLFSGFETLDEEYARGFGVSEARMSASATPPAENTGADAVYPPAGNDFHFDACTKWPDSAFCRTVEGTVQSVGRTKSGPDQYAQLDQFFKRLRDRDLQPQPQAFAQQWADWLDEARQLLKSLSLLTHTKDSGDASSCTFRKPLCRKFHEAQRTMSQSQHPTGCMHSHGNSHC